MVLLSAAVLILGIAVGTMIGLLRARHTSPALQLTAPTPPMSSWAAGKRLAPDFRLVDQSGAPISLHALRGRMLIVTFIDPLCRNLCPLEASVLSNAVRTLPPATRPAIVSVSVNPWGDTRANFRADAKHWGLGAAWRWAIGPRPQLAAVWKEYEIAVQVVTKRVAGVAVREIGHSEVAYIVDRAGYERALFIYPFTAADVEHEIHKLDSSS